MKQTASAQSGGTGVVEATTAPRTSITLMRVCDHCWRVEATSASEVAAPRLLGFVEQRDATVFEAMQLGTTFTWQAYGSLTEAVDHLTHDHEATLAMRSVGDLAWVS